MRVPIVDYRSIAGKVVNTGDVSSGTVCMFVGCVHVLVCAIGDVHWPVYLVFDDGGNPIYWWCNQEWRCVLCYHSSWDAIPFLFTHSLALYWQRISCGISFFWFPLMYSGFFIKEDRKNLLIPMKINCTVGCLMVLLRSNLVSRRLVVPEAELLF